MKKYRYVPVDVPRPCVDPIEDAAVPSVCGNCGADLERHVKATTYKPYHEAVWDWLLEHGGVKSYYGNVVDQRDSENVINHLNECGIDYEKTTEPRLNKLEEFDGTFNDPAYTDVMTGYLYCKCGKLHGQQWGLVQPLTLGEIIYQVIQRGKLA